MTFTVWISEFCSDHVKFQTIYEILEANRLADLFGIVKTLTIPRRSREINDSRFREYNYENGIKHGICREWYSNGQIWYEGNFVNGRIHGMCREWYQNGKLSYEDNYEHGKDHGICRGWHQNGKLSYEYNYEHGKLIN